MVVSQQSIKALDPDLKAKIRERVQRIPIMDTLNISITEMGEGYCALKIPYKKAYDGIFECFHGGLIMTAADTVACFAVMTFTAVKLATTEITACPPSLLSE